jgi:glutamyl-tRNA synthetase
LNHAKCAYVNYLYAKKYRGEFILRFEDSDPRKCRKEFYDAFIEGLRWIGIKPDRIDHLSNHLERFYKAAEKLLRKGLAYVCVCKPSVIRRNRKLMKECRCRQNPPDKNLELWRKMFKEFGKGQAVLRLRIDMRHRNAAMRDPGIFRIIDRKHPRTGRRYRVWPTYDFACALLDAWEGITHRIRSKEFEMRTELQQHIQALLGLPSPWIDVIGRLNLVGVPTSGRKIRALIEEGKLSGWDDPRLTTLIALRRRGFHPKALRDFLLRTGVSKAEATLTWDVLESVNRSVIDGIANRYFCVLDPVRISIVGAPAMKQAKIPLHPDFPERGKRRVEVNLSNIYVEMKDLRDLKGKEVGLMYLCTVLLGKQARFLSKRVRLETKKIHWVTNPIKVRIVMKDGSIKEALAESGLKELRVDELVQMPRVGFCRVDRIKPRITLYYTHE